MSGLLALALFDFELHYYCTIGHVLGPLHQVLERRGKRTSSDYNIARKFSRWLPPLSAITALLGPTSGLLEEICEGIAGSFPIDTDAAGLRNAIISETQGEELRAAVTLPDDMASEFQALRPICLASCDITGVPQQLGALIAGLRDGLAVYDLADFRTEFSWWLERTPFKLKSFDDHCKPRTQALRAQ